MSARSAALTKARTILTGFTAGQRAVTAIGALALVLGAFALTQWAAQPSWAPLYGNLSGTDASAITDALTAQGVQYKLSDGGNTVLVPQDQVYQLRVTMAGKGLPSSDSQGGWSLLDSQGITATDFQQNIAYRRALEGELAKTLEAMDGVNTAIVHLAIPQKTVFTTTADKPTASVLLSLRPGATIQRTQVQSITRLVAGSVEGLDPAQVTVTDQSGNQLSVPDDATAAAAAAASEADAQTATFEDRQASKLQDMLDQVLGTGRAVVRVNAQLNFDSQDATSQQYLSPSPVAPLAESTVTETYSGSGAGAGGILGQLNPTAAATAGGGGSYARDQQTRNNALGTVVTRKVAAPGAVQKLSVAVFLDATTAGGVNPTVIQGMVANAVGLNSGRGDTVQVSSIPFDTTAAKTAQSELAAAAAAQQKQSYIDLGTKAGIGLVALIVLLLWSRKRKKAARITATASDLPAQTQSALASIPIQAQPGGLPALPGAADDSELERDRMREELSAFVENQTDDVARMLQSWLSEGKG